MQYRNLGNTGLIVSRLSFGAMNFASGSHSLGAIFKTEEQEAGRLVGQALDAGINFFDTANTYAAGESEEMLGRALGHRRDEVVIATKVAMRPGRALIQSGLSRQHILWSVDQSLKRLGTDWIDVLIVHREDPFTPMEETLEALDAVVRAGKVRYIGFSNWAAWKVSAAIEMQKANGWAKFTHGQMYYSLVGRDLEFEIIPMMQQYGLGLTVWSPMAGGFLSGKYTRENLKDDPGNRITSFDFLPFDKDRGFDLVDQMRAMGQSHGASVAQVALAWLLAKPAVTSVIVGASKTAQLDDNLGAAQLTLSADEIATLDAGMPPPRLYPGWYNDIIGDGMTAAALGVVPGDKVDRQSIEAHARRPERTD